MLAIISMVRNALIYYCEDKIGILRKISPLFLWLLHVVTLCLWVS